MTSIQRPDSVRLALATEAAQIARVQLAWLAARPSFAELAAGMDAAEVTEAWTLAITRPPLANYRVLVALDSAGDVVGFTAVGPSDDPDAEETDGLVAEFVVHPDAHDAGHEDRLMHAAVDTLRADGFERATWWVLADDDATRALLTESGWETDGAHQEIGDEDDHLRIKQVRLHTALA